MLVFVPVAVVTSSWQAALGAGGLFPIPLWPRNVSRPWAEGLLPAIWIHTQVALPWVIVIVGQGLRWVEADLEEDALLATGPWRVLWRVTLPRTWGAILAGAVWVALQVSTEMTVADLMLVRTFAEEVYAQFWQGGEEAVARAVAASLPMVALSTAGVVWAWRRLERTVPALEGWSRVPHDLHLGRARWPALALMLAGVAVLAGVPLSALVWKTGLTGWPPVWSTSVAAQQLGAALHGNGLLVAESVATVLAAGVLIASLALVLCWLALDASRFRRWLIFFVALAWSLPGPILGVGLATAILWIVVWLPWRPLSVALYDGPSPLPVLWAYVLRYLPLAVVALWPVVRLLPRDLRDSVRLDGATPRQELLGLVLPLVRRPWLMVGVVIAALAIGEVGAVAVSVETPGWRTFTTVLFDRMHFGTPNEVSALCLVLVLMIAAGGCAALAVIRLAAARSAATPPALPVPHSAPPPR